jgi:hypothetical protein
VFGALIGRELRKRDEGTQKTYAQKNFFFPQESREAQKQNRRMGIWSGIVTIWATSRARVPRRDPNFSPNHVNFRLGDPAIGEVRVEVYRGR